MSKSCGVHLWCLDVLRVTVGWAIRDSEGVQWVSRRSALPLRAFCRSQRIDQFKQHKTAIEQWVYASRKLKIHQQRRQERAKGQRCRTPMAPAIHAAVSKSVPGKRPEGECACWRPPQCATTQECASQFGVFMSILFFSSRQPRFPTGTKMKRAQWTTTPTEHQSPYQGIYMHA